MTSKQETMRAVFIEDFGGPEQLKVGRLHTPLPQAGEVQIRIAYTAVNPVDWKIRIGLLQKKLPHHFPLTPGWDASGIVSMVGPGVTKFKVGDPVYAYCRKPIVQQGTYAEFICFSANEIAHKPKTISFAQAAAIPLAGLTAWQALFNTVSLKKGESVLIQAGAGGVGSLAIQFAKQAGAYVITTASAANQSFVKNLGADLIIDYHSHSVSEQIKKKFPGGIDVVFDTVGGDALEESYSILKPGGRLVSIVQPPNQAYADERKIKLFYHFVSPNGEELQKIAELIDAHKVKPIPIREKPLEEAAEAQEENRQGHVQGKIVLKVQDVLSREGSQGVSHN